MIRKKLFGIGLILTLVMSVGLIGCSSDDDDGTSGTSGGGGGTSGDGSGNTFTGVVRNIVGDVPVPGMKVVALSNDTDFRPLGAEATSDANGVVTLSGLTGELMCVKILATGEGKEPIPAGDEERIDTYTCNVETNAQNRSLISTPLSIAAGIDGALNPGQEPIPSLSSASGGVYYIGADGTEYPVDCVTVEAEEAVEGQSKMYYFNGSLPDQTKTQTDAGGRFLVTKLNPGLVHLNAIYNGQVIGSTSLPLQAPAVSGATYNGNITRIYTEGSTDPTPEGCASE